MIEKKNSQFNVKISQHNKIEKFQLRWKSNPRYDIHFSIEFGKHFAVVVCKVNF